jgi:hypothetical protein
MDKNVIVNNFLNNAVLVSQECFHSLPASSYRRLAQALENGSEIEVRANLRIGAPAVSIWLLDLAGKSELIASSEHFAQ